MTKRAGAIAFCALLALILCCTAQAEIIAAYQSVGDTVTEIQTNLLSLEYLTRQPSGKFDQKTVSAVKTFQTANELGVTGAVDEVTYEALKSDTAVNYTEYIERVKDAQLTVGGKGKYVKPIEKRLNALGYGTIKADSYYTESTVGAVMKFQRAHKLTQTGAVDRATRAQLYAVDVVKYASWLKANNLTTLKKGMKGAQVSYITTQLVALGYLTGASSTYTSVVRSAVWHFQNANGITPTGVASLTTRDLLNQGGAVDFPTYFNLHATAEIQKGDKGYSVEILQTYLKNLRYYSGAINSVYTEAVRLAVVKFQKYNGLGQTGVADMNTRVAMMRDDCLGRIDVEGLKLGDNCSEVLAMLTRLRALGYYRSVKTTKYTKAAYAAVKLFQKAHGLAVTGAADAEVTLPRIHSDNVITYQAYRMSQQGSGRVNAMIDFAYKFLGRPYRTGSACNPPKSFDCSRFTRYVLAKMGVSVSGAVATQGKALATKFGRISDRSAIKRGDLLYFSSDSDSTHSSIRHAAIYMGTNSVGKMCFIHASSAAGKVVVTSWNDYYTRNWLFAVRIWG